MFKAKDKKFEVKVPTKLEPVTDYQFQLAIRILNNAIENGQILLNNRGYSATKIAFETDIQGHWNMDYLAHDACMAFELDKFTFVSPEEIEQNRIVALKLELQKAKETHDLATKKIEDLSRALGVTNG